MGGAGIEVVSRAIEIHREDKNGVEAVLLPVGLGLDKHHLLRQAVRRVGLLGIPVPDVILPEGNGGELGVGADRPQTDELVDSPEIPLVKELHPHHDVVVEQGGGVFRVVSDAADPGGQMEYDVGPLFIIEAPNALDIHQVVFGKVRHGHPAVPFPVQIPEQVGPQEPFPAGYADAFFFHNSLRSSTTLPGSSTLLSRPFS